MTIKNALKKITELHAYWTALKCLGVVTLAAASIIWAFFTHQPNTNITDLLVNRADYIDREIVIEGVVIDVFKEPGAAGPYAVSCYIRGDDGGVILVKTPQMQPLIIDKRYRLVGAVKQNKSLKEPTFIAQKIADTQENALSVVQNRLTPL